MKQVMGVARFKSAVRRSEVPSDLQVRKAIPVLIENTDSPRRKLFTISTETIDRDNDMIALKGWKLDNFIRSPSVFFNHDTRAYPIGKAVEIGISGHALKSVVQFMDADIPDGAGERAESVFRQVDGGYISSCSVGFRPLKYSIARDRMDDDDWWPAMNFEEQELCEWSVCGVPANPDATVEDEERAAVIDLRKQFEEERAVARAAIEASSATERAANLAAWQAIRAAAYS